MATLSYIGFNLIKKFIALRYTCLQSILIDLGTGNTIRNAFTGCSWDQRINIGNVPSPILVSL